MHLPLSTLSLMQSFSIFYQSCQGILIECTILTVPASLAPPGQCLLPHAPSVTLAGHAPLVTHSHMLDPFALKYELPTPHLLMAHPSSPFKLLLPPRALQSGHKPSPSATAWLHTVNRIAHTHPWSITATIRGTLPPSQAAPRPKVGSPHPSHWANWVDEFRFESMFSDLKLSFSSGSQARVSSVGLPSTP